MEVIFPPVEDSINLASPHESDSTELVPYPAWGGEYNDILQSNTCSIENILAIISSNKTTITKSLELHLHGIRWWLTEDSILLVTLPIKVILDIVS